MKFEREALMTHEEEISLARKIRDTEIEDEKIRLRNEFIERNLGLAAAIAKGYTTTGLSFDDLFQEGCRGLLRAVEKFDPELGNKFSTYALKWIRVYMQRAFAYENSIIRIPPSMVEIWRTYKKAEIILTNLYGYKPSIEEVAVYMIKNCKLGKKSTKNPERLAQKLELLKEKMRPMLSMDESMVDDGNPLHDILEDQNSQNEFLEMKDEDILEKFWAELNECLSKREKLVVNKRIGERTKNDKGEDIIEDSLTLERTGKIFGVSRQRIEQIEKRAHRKIKRKIKKSPKLLMIICSDENLINYLPEKMRI